MSQLRAPKTLNRPMFSSNKMPAVAPTEHRVFRPLPASDCLRSELRQLTRAALPWIADAIGVICLFFILFIGLFLEVIFS